MDITGPEWKYGNDLWITDDKTSSFSYQSDFSSSNFLTPLYTRWRGSWGASSASAPEQQNRRDSKFGGKINILNGKFDFLR